MHKVRFDSCIHGCILVASLYLLLPIYYHILRACNYIFLQNLCIFLFKFYVWSCLKYQDINNKAKTYFSCAVVMLCFYKVALLNVVSIAYYAWQYTLCWHNVIGIIKSYLHYECIINNLRVELPSAMKYLGKCKVVVQTPYKIYILSRAKCAK